MSPEFENRDNSDPTNLSRAATLTIGPQSLVASIEQASEPMANREITPPIHSSTSQKDDVSFSSGDAAHILSSFQLENVDIEIEGSLPLLQTSIEHSLSVTNYIMPLFEPSISFNTSTYTQGISFPVITSIDLLNASQGSDGSPGGVNITKAPLIGTSVVPDDSVSPTGQSFIQSLTTGSLVDSGLPSNFVTSEELNSFKTQCLSAFEKMQTNLDELTAKSKSNQMENKVESLSKDIQSLKDAVDDKMNGLKDSMEDRVDKVDDSVILLQEDVSKAKQEVTLFVSENVVTKKEFTSFQACILKNFENLSKTLITAFKENCAKPESSTSGSEIPSSGPTPIPAVPKSFVSSNFDRYMYKVEFDALNDKMETMEDEMVAMRKEMKELTKQCKVQAKLLKRKFDDHDPDNQKGESNKRQMTEPAVVAEEVVDVSSSSSESNSQSDQNQKGDQRQADMFADKTVNDDEMVQEAEIIQNVEIVQRVSEVGESSSQGNQSSFKVNQCWISFIQNFIYNVPRHLSIGDVSVFKRYFVSIDENIDEEVGYTERFYDEMFFNFVNEEDVLDVLMPDYDFKKPIIIPKMQIQLLEEPIVDFVIKEKEGLFDHPSECYDVYPEETYSNLFLSEKEDPSLLEHWIDGRLPGELQMMFSELFVKERRNDKALMVDSRIENVVEFQRIDFAQVSYTVLRVKRENGGVCDLSSLNFDRLKVADQMFLMKFFERADDALTLLEIRRILGIYIRNLSMYDL